MLMIYGKYKSDKRFAPMDMNSGSPVSNKMYATMYNDKEKDRLENQLLNLMINNPDWKFEVRSC